ncbi:MAG: replication-associated recombination protein A [Candidatus Aminicenantes bacterium]|nr:replication-associated recombination protein A [Candidatus Aminicenantes bacterium]
MNHDFFPLADKLRPQRLADFEGQEHLTGQRKVIQAMVRGGSLASMIFWGPPGSGKTTLARILVRETAYPSAEFSATVSGIGEIKKLMEKSLAARRERGKPLVLFVDEIHHFNRNIQDAFLPYVERGDIILLGTTTENPAYKINRALLSRLKILELFPLKEEHLRRILARALAFIATRGGASLRFTPEAEAVVVGYSNGDSRRLLNLVEIVFQTADLGKPVGDAAVFDIIQNKVAGYDRTGDDRYQLISALHKSVRNSDVDAALFWLYRMLEGGEDPLYILRRMVRMAVEDIGLADPDALRICLNAKQAYEFLGSPEGDLFLSEAAVYLALAPKSNALYVADGKMKSLAEKYKMLPVPLSIVNPDNFIAAGKGAGKGYVYAHDLPEKTSLLRTLPDGVVERGFYEPGSMGFEKHIRERLAYWKKVKAEMSKTGGKDDVEG